MPIEIISVRLEINNPKVKDKLETIVSSLEGFRIQEPGTSGSVDLLIMETGEDIKKTFRILDSFNEAGFASEIFLTSSRTDQEILIQALRKGVKEFFAQPVKEDEVKTALLKFKDRRKESAKKKRNGEIINLIAAKGGVGTTTVAVNLAVSLIELRDVGRMVALVDMNPQLGEIPLFLDVELTYHWGDIARNIDRMDTTYLMGVLSKHPTGIYIMPSPPGLEDIAEINPKSVLKILDAMREVFDFIVIDSGQALNNIAISVLDISDSVFLVSVLNLPCLANAKRILDTFYKLNYPMENVKIIINRYLRNSEISLKDAENSLDKKPFWIIPNDYPISMSSINQGKPISAVDPRSGISKSFKNLAAALVEKEEIGKESSTGWKFWKSRK